MAFHRSKPDQDSNQPSKIASGLKGYIEAEKLMQTAMVLPSAVLIGWGAGAWAEHLLHQKWLVVAGVVFGSVAGLFYVIQSAFSAEKKLSREDAVQDKTGKGSSGNLS
jgi:F0F1-type ATP synthase assembly protein I